MATTQTTIEKSGYQSRIAWIEAQLNQILSDGSTGDILLKYSGIATLVGMFAYGCSAALLLSAYTYPVVVFGTWLVGMLAVAVVFFTFVAGIAIKLAAQSQPS